jgi:hypothetical protein
MPELAPVTRQTFPRIDAVCSNAFLLNEENGQKFVVERVGHRVF